MRAWPGGGSSGLPQQRWPHRVPTVARCRAKIGPGGPDPSGPPGESGKWGRSSLTDRGEFPRPKPSVNLNSPNLAARTRLENIPVTSLNLAPPRKVFADTGDLRASRRAQRSGCSRLPGPLKNSSPGRTVPAASASWRSVRSASPLQAPIGQHLAVGIHRAAAEIAVDDPRALAALGDRRDDQRLADPRVAAGVHAVRRRCGRSAACWMLPRRSSSSPRSRRAPRARGARTRSRSARGRPRARTRCRAPASGRATRCP